MKKIIALALAAMMLFSLAACGSGDDSGDAKTYTVGICQLVQHPALDAATQGFKDVLTEEFGDAVTFDEGNASGDSATCATICNGFVSNSVDLILANATASLQAAAAATNEIPVLGTSITEYGVALEIENFNGTVGGNVSGTSDLAPLDQQADMITELFPDTKTVGILYCSGEPNSVYQANVVKECLEAKNIKVDVYTFADSNDVSTVTASACAESDVIYIPTDNTAASNMTIVSNICTPAGIPVICGEEGMCGSGGLATVSISYYDIGYVCGEMAYEILVNGADVSAMPIGYAANPVKKYNADVAEAIAFEMPEEYEAIVTD